MHEVQCAGSEDPLVTWWSGMAWKRRPEQAAVRQGRLGAAALLSGHSAGACAEAHSHHQRVSNVLRGCARPERSAPSCGIHTALGGRAEPLVAAPNDADHVLVSRANIFADEATGLDRHRKFSYGISTEHGTRPHSTAGEVPERTRPRCNTSTQTRTVRKKVSEPRTFRA